MKRIETTMIVGLALVSVGILSLLESLNILGPLRSIAWSLIFGAGGIVFLSVFARTRERWWALIPGFTLLSLGVLIGLDSIVPDGTGTWGGALFLAGMGLGFWAVYLTERARWWAVIPGGVLCTLAVVAGLAESIPGMLAGGVFFLGLGLTFLLVYLLPTPEEHRRWALVPTALALLMALLLVVGTVEVASLFWPVMLILAGLYLAFRSLRSRHIWHTGDSPASER